MERNPESERFVRVAQAEDPFTADALEAVLRKSGWQLRDHPGGSGVEALGSGWALPWFELSVLEEHVARAREGRWKPSGCGWRRKRPRPSARPRRRSASRDGQAVLTAAGAQRVVLDTVGGGTRVADLPERHA